MFVISVGILVVLIIFLLILPNDEPKSSVGDLPSFLDQVIQNKTSTTLDKKITELVKFYRGDDGKGDTIVEVLTSKVGKKFSIESIIDSSSEIGWYTVRDYTNEDMYTVGFILQTQNNIDEYIWKINKTDEKIVGVNKEAREILNIVNLDG
jgi:hypothetical protein